MKKFVSVAIMSFLMFTYNHAALASDNISTPANLKMEQGKLQMLESLHRSESSPQFDAAPKHQLHENINLKDHSHSLTQPEGLAATNTYTGTIPTPGQSAYLYPIYAQPGTALQVQLDNPSSLQLDYDLYLYQFDMTTGNLNPNPIDYSILGTYANSYPSGSKTISENVGTKNTTSGAVAYMVEVYAKTGASINDPFKVTVSTNATYDAYETDESPFHAYSFTVGTGGSSLSSRTVNTEIDNDWYVVSVPATRNYDALNVTLDSTSTSQGYRTEVYQVLTGNRMQLVPAVANNVSVGTGSYYVRVYTTGTYSDTNPYTLALKPILRAGKIVITGFNSASGPNDYPNYSYGSYYRIQGNSFTVNGVVATTDNYAVANTKVDVNWENDYWSETSGNRYRSGSSYTNSNGEFSVTLSLPPSRGSLVEYLSGAISFTHYFDLCGVTARVSNTSLVQGSPVYHFAYSVYGG